MKPPYTLSQESLSHDTVQTLERLLDEARAGQIVGIAYAVIMRKRRYVVNTTGEAYRSPTFTRGVVAALDDHLHSLVHQPASS